MKRVFRRTHIVINDDRLEISKPSIISGNELLVRCVLVTFELLTLGAIIYASYFVCILPGKFGSPRWETEIMRIIGLFAVNFLIFCVYCFSVWVLFNRSHLALSSGTLTYQSEVDILWPKEQFSEPFSCIHDVHLRYHEGYFGIEFVTDSFQLFTFKFFRTIRSGNLKRDKALFAPILAEYEEIVELITEHWNEQIEKVEQGMPPCHHPKPMP